MLEIKKTAVTSPEAQVLLAELNAALTHITGCSGAARFDPADVRPEQGVFLTAWVDGQLTACGAVRRAEKDAAEIKRVYARPNEAGAARAVVAALEAYAKETLGCTRAILETRKVNRHAIDFYHSLGYAVRPNYGAYVGREEAVCFEKGL